MKKHLFIALLSLLPLGLMAQENEVVPFNGIVTDLMGTPLRGVKIYVTDANYAAKSDRKGRFGLSNVKGTDTLHVVFRKLHYDIPVAGRKAIRIRLADQSAPQAEEDVALADIGYGFVSRRELLTSSNGISGEVIRRTGKTNLLEALTGLVPGLNVHSSGVPGGPVSSTIRGIGSINSSNEPLYLVDGVEVSTLDMINLNDVESVEVMKDGTIYGSRGANGIISVHLKKR
jgi:hypothetical protein